MSLFGGDLVILHDDPFLLEDFVSVSDRLFFLEDCRTYLLNSGLIKTKRALTSACILRVSKPNRVQRSEVPAS